MGEHPGKVIKSIAVVLYFLSSIGLFVFLLSKTSLFLLGIPIALGISYIVWLPIYAIGHLLCKVDEIAESTKNTEVNTECMLNNIECILSNIENSKTPNE